MNTFLPDTHQIMCVVPSLETFWSGELYHRIKKFTEFSDQFEAACITIIKPALRDYLDFLHGGGHEFSIEFARFEDPDLPRRNYSCLLAFHRHILFQGQLVNSNAWQSIEFSVQYPDCDISVHAHLYDDDRLTPRKSESIKRHLDLKKISLEFVKDLFEESIS